MQTSPKGLDLIKGYEKFRSKPYMPTPNDKPTIGYGTTVYPSGVPVTLKDPEITETRALELLAYDVTRFEQALQRLCPTPLNQNEFDALVSFIYNIGIGNFTTSTMRRKINSRDFAGAADEFPRWNKQAGKVLAGLTKRRATERALFLA